MLLAVRMTLGIMIIACVLWFSLLMGIRGLCMSVSHPVIMKNSLQELVVMVIAIMCAQCQYGNCSCNSLDHALATLTSSLSLYTYIMCIYTYISMYIRNSICITYVYSYIICLELHHC